MPVFACFASVYAHRIFSLHMKYSIIPTTNSPVIINRAAISGSVSSIILLPQLGSSGICVGSCLPMCLVLRSTKFQCVLLYML